MFVAKEKSVIFTILLNILFIFNIRDQPNNGGDLSIAPPWALA